ncbi:MAG TPA: hypothetical protein VK849_01220 [Longimicrobiales bacterium]|nr:hypothetical protein [Longimicrobiales bacterium]
MTPQAHAGSRGPSTLLAALLAASAACGGDAPPPDAAESGEDAGEVEESFGTNPYWDAGDLCALVPLADVAEAAGGIEPFSAEADETPPVSCRYFFDAPDPSGPRSTSATLQMLDGYGLERIGAGDSAIDVDGVGDEAWGHLLPDTYILYARRGDLVFSVNVAGGGEEEWPEMARSIAEVVLAHL